jgi:hypothetical protein
LLALELFWVGNSVLESAVMLEIFCEIGTDKEMAKITSMYNILISHAALISSHITRAIRKVTSVYFIK